VVPISSEVTRIGVAWSYEAASVPNIRHFPMFEG
jgi:hypothetical protein